MPRYGLVRLAVFFVTGLFTAPAEAAELVVDRAIMVHSGRALAQKRRALLQYLWGAEGFPTRRLPDAVVTNVACPVKQLDHLARVEPIWAQCGYEPTDLVEAVSETASWLRSTYPEWYG